MAYSNKALRDWSNEDIIEWLPSLGLSAKWLGSVKEAVSDNGITGKDLLSLRNPNDVKDVFDVNMIACRRLFKAIKEKKEKDEDQRIQNAMSQGGLGSGQGAHTRPTSAYGHEQKEEKFEICIFAQNKQMTLKNKATTSTLVSEIQRWYKEEAGVSTPAGDIRLTAWGKLLQSEKTLKEVNIVDEKHLITVQFKTPGGLAQASEFERVREIKFKKYGIKKSSQADCLVGYDDTDYIDRADIGCGHAMAASTMYKYIEQVLEKNPKAVAIPCPICHKILDWQHCTRVADMNRDEFLRWTAIIEQRLAGDQKKCPHCKALCQRKEGVLIFRMRCAACNGPDWCWNCMKQWRVGGLIYCGDSQCPLIQHVDKTLADAELFTPEYLTNVKIPRIRACPMCLTFVEHKEACKHINCCPGCSGAFCFVCLGIKKNGNWPCKDHRHECPPAPVQSHKNNYGHK